MVRTQIQLTEEQVRVLHQKASERETSVAQLIREAIDASLAADDETERRRRALEVVGRFDSGLDDVGEEHDRYLADDFR
ncbi:MAG: ribbon-helix-helix protein, CopG family [Candidatus Dormibacteraeota bacterium]|nr:ribbon-helix-helix protein, CopG family [Candidatus Dormibacteraeota bacterium]